MILTPASACCWLTPCSKTSGGTSYASPWWPGRLSLSSPPGRVRLTRNLISSVNDSLPLLRLSMPRTPSTKYGTIWCAGTVIGNRSRFCSPSRIGVEATGILRLPQNSEATLPGVTPSLGLIR